MKRLVKMKHRRMKRNTDMFKGIAYSDLKEIQRNRLFPPPSTLPSLVPYPPRN